MSKPRTFLDGRVVLWEGDCRDVLRGMADNSVDSVVTDPPYGINFMSKKWDDSIAFQPELWAEVLRVLKPGGYIIAFSGCRTYHHMATAIENAGFLTFPFLVYAFGSGFPKATRVNLPGYEDWRYGAGVLKPALEPIYFGQKPFEKGLNGAENVQKWGTGAINVGACKIPSSDLPYDRTRHGGGIKGNGTSYELPSSHEELGHSRWPSNLLLDNSDEVLACFPNTAPSPAVGSMGGGSKGYVTFENGLAGKRHENGHGDSGSAARFFASFPQEEVVVKRIWYGSKAAADDRLGSSHPTVKSVALIQYLVRLITPKNGICLDLFAGTGVTGEACFRESFRAVLIERETEYIKDIERRMSLVMAGPNERAHAGMKARGRPRDDGPLFGHEEKAREKNIPEKYNAKNPYLDEGGHRKRGLYDEATE